MDQPIEKSSRISAVTAFLAVVGTSFGLYQLYQYCKNLNKEWSKTEVDKINEAFIASYKSLPADMTALDLVAAAAQLPLFQDLANKDLALKFSQHLTGELRMKGWLEYMSESPNKRDVMIFHDHGDAIEMDQNRFILSEITLSEIIRNARTQDDMMNLIGSTLESLDEQKATAKIVNDAELSQGLEHYNLSQEEASTLIFNTVEAIQHYAFLIQTGGRGKDHLEMRIEGSTENLTNAIETTNILNQLSEILLRTVSQERKFELADQFIFAGTYIRSRLDMQKVKDINNAFRDEQMAEEPTNTYRSSRFFDFPLE